MSRLVELAVLFGKISLLAVGGANATVPQIIREVVDHRHWVSPAQFAQLYAISNTAPGPNVLISTIIGTHVAGVLGGIVATGAMILPSCGLAVLVAGWFERHREAGWRRMVQASLLPITAGLVLAAAIMLAWQSDTGVLTVGMTIAAFWLAAKTRLHPLWLLGGGAVLGLVLG